MDQEINTGKADSHRYYRVGELIVDMEAHCAATRDGHPLAIDDTSLRLLVALVNAAPEAVSVADLQGAAGGDLAMTADDVLEHIQSLARMTAIEGDRAVYVGGDEADGCRVKVQPVRPRVRHKMVPKFLVPLMILLVLLVPVVAYLLAG